MLFMAYVILITHFLTELQRACSNFPPFRHSPVPRFSPSAFCWRDASRGVIVRCWRAITVRNLWRMTALRPVPRSVS